MGQLQGGMNACHCGVCGGCVSHTLQLTLQAPGEAALLSFTLHEFQERQLYSVSHCIPHHTSYGTVCLHPQYLGELGADFVVFKNDEKTVDEIRAMNPAGILVSPRTRWGCQDVSDAFISFKRLPFSCNSFCAGFVVHCSAGCTAGAVLLTQWVQAGCK